jgi:Family of unknown function (DUF6069)
MHASAWRSAGVVVVATVVALGTWAVVRLLGVELTVGKGPDPSQVGAVEVAAATVLAGLAAWAVHRVLARSARTARWWPFVGTTAIAVSIIGPNYLADGAAAVALISLHLIVGAILIAGLARFAGAGEHLGRRAQWTTTR